MPRQTVQVTQQQYLTLVAKREELNDQLTSLSNARQRLVGERREAAANQYQSVVAELDARITELGTRIVRVEREKLATDDAITAAISSGITRGDGSIVIDLPRPPQIPVIAGGSTLHEGAIREEYREMMMIEAAGFILLGFALWRWMKYRFTRQLAARQVSGETPAAKELKDAVYAMAVEIERISENQRFVTRLLSEKQQEERAMVERDRSDRS